MSNIQALVEIRNELYDNLPTGKVHAFDLITVIKDHLKKLDEFIDAPIGELASNEQLYKIWKAEVK
jgi:hypothetical protein